MRLAAGPERRLRFQVAATGAAGVAATITAALITSGNLRGEGAALAALARASMVAVPIAVGLYTWSRRPAGRIGRVIVAVGFACFLTTLAESNVGLVYSIGRVSAWVLEAGIVWLILAFPSGRISARVDRALMGATVALLVVLYLPTIFIADGFPVPNPFTSCLAGCPENAFSLVQAEPAFLEAAIVPIRETLNVLIFLAVTARVAQRVLRATPLTRLTLSPVLVIASARMALFAIGLVVRRISPSSVLVEGIAWALALAIPALAAAFLLGLFQRRLYVANALQRLGATARGKLSLEELQAVLAEAVGDPGLQLVYRANGGRARWVDTKGKTVEIPTPTSGLCLTEVREQDRLVAGVIHDDALRDEIDFVRAAASLALIVLENRRLAVQVASSLEELRESRSRILASGDRERRRIERDLHDGAQQRLVVLGIQLELTEDLIREDSERGLEKLRALGDEVGKTLEEIQALARGVYPSLLTDRGLGPALEAAALRLPIEAKVDRDGLGRYPADVENAVYFCCLEAMQNASKHARDAQRIVIVLGEDDGLVFEVRDDGAGFEPTDLQAGAGLTNMQDRLAALGGELEVRSTPGGGTVAAGRVPLGGG